MDTILLTVCYQCARLWAAALGCPWDRAGDDADDSGSDSSWETDWESGVPKAGGSGSGSGSAGGSGAAAAGYDADDSAAGGARRAAGTAVGSVTAMLQDLHPPVGRCKLKPVDTRVERDCYSAGNSNMLNFFNVLYSMSSCATSPWAPPSLPPPPPLAPPPDSPPRPRQRCG